jgi:hypothetical protein
MDINLWSSKIVSFELSKIHIYNFGWSFKVEGFVGNYGGDGIE